MTGTPSPTWYDVLGVPRDATPGQIKAAWRSATDKFEPGSGAGQFRTFSEAADVLLDPERRAAYDAALAGEEPAGSLQAETRTDPVVSAPSSPAPASTGATAAAVSSQRSRRQRQQRQRQWQRPSARVLAVLAVLALLAVAALVVAGRFVLQYRDQAAVADARDQAPVAAETAAKAMLSYDYRHLPSDRQRAEAFMTPSYKKKYDQTFSLLEKQKDGTPGAAVQTKTVVTATVLGSGVVDAEDNAARVLVYVNQVSTKPGVDPQIFQNRVAMTMRKIGNSWLVDDLKSY